MNAEFSATMSELAPLKAHITATDKLIDQIVYELYNLTEDEIAVVEGKDYTVKTAQDSESTDATP